MRSMSILTCLLPAAILAGCADEPVAPRTDALTPPAFAAVHDEFTVPVPWDGVHQLLPCLGWVTTYGSFDAHFRTTTTPSGNEVYQWWLSFNDPYGFTVDETGEDWPFLKGVDTGGSLTKPTGAYSESWSDVEWNANASGQKVRVVWIHHLKVDADENVSLERDLFKCHVFE